MRRRSYVALSGVLLSTGLAGCGSNDGDSEPTDDESSPTADDDPEETTESGPESTDVTATRTASPNEEQGEGGSTTDENEDMDTVTPAPTASPTATETRTATATPEPTATPSQDGQRYSFSGSSDSVTDRFTVQGGFTSFDMAHSGESNFQVELIDTDSGDTQEFLANEIGQWEGLLPYEVPEGEYVLDVTADGSWEIIVRQPRHTIDDTAAVPVTGEDEFPNYLGPVEFEGFHTVRGAYDGDSNFAVWLLDENGGEVDLLFNEVGNFEGETTTNYEGMGYIRVEATGPWRIDVE